jgi:hypothetical protein
MNAFLIATPCGYGASPGVGASSGGTAPVSRQARQFLPASLQLLSADYLPVVPPPAIHFRITSPATRFRTDPALAI